MIESAFIWKGWNEFYYILIWIASLAAIFIAYTLFMPQIMGLQSRFAIRGAKQSLDKLENWSDDSKNTALRRISNFGRTRRELKEEVEDFLEFFAIKPVSEDPRGVLDRLEHILDVRDKRFEEKVERLAPEADKEEAADLEMTLQGALASYILYKVVRHFVRVAEKTSSMQLAQLLQMQLPMLERMGEAYNTATSAFAERKVIGDGIGAMVASELIGEEEAEEEIEDTVFAKTEIEGRRAYVIKAKGPGGRVGKPGELIRELAENREPDRIFMADAGLKMEGEESGKVVEGVGAAIGGPPTEKHKIEELATERDIPVDAIVIREGLMEAITPMTTAISNSVDIAVEKIKEAVKKRTDEDDVIFVAGIGNTIGVGQDPSRLPTEFPEPEKKEDELESFLPLPGVGGISSELKSSKLKRDYGHFFRKR